MKNVARKPRDGCRGVDLEVEDGERRRPHLVHERGEELVHEREELPEDADEEHGAEAEHRDGCGGVDEEEVGHPCHGGPLVHERGKELPKDVADEEHGAEAEPCEGCVGVDEEEDTCATVALMESTALSRLLTW